MYISVQSPFPSPPAPPPLAATYLLLCSGHVLWMESYNMWPFWCLTFCTLHVFKANPFGSLNQYSFYGWVVNRCRTFPGSSMVKNLPALQETWFSLWVGRSSGGGHGHPLQCSCLENQWTEEPGGLQSMGSQRFGHDWNDLACMLGHRWFKGEDILQSVLKTSDKCS